MSLAPGTRLSPYEIQSVLGAGGMGEVYRARDTRLDRTVAIKVLPSHVATDPSLKQRFEREARTLAALSHPHICPVFDVGQQDPSTGSGQAIHYIVMDLRAACHVRLGQNPKGNRARPRRSTQEMLLRTRRLVAEFARVLPSQTIALSAGTRLGPYEIQAALDSGGMEVYRARGPTRTQ